MGRDIIDRQFLDSMATKKPFLKKMFSVFVSQEPKRVREIREALESGDVLRIKHLAHSLKGGAATMGADRVREACLNIENATKANDLEKARKLYGDLEKEMNQAYTFMFSYIADN